MKVRKVELDQPEDEPGAEDRFMRGVAKELNTPPKPFTKPVNDKKEKEGKA